MILPTPCPPVSGCREYPMAMIVRYCGKTAQVGSICIDSKSAGHNGHTRALGPAIQLGELIRDSSTTLPQTNNH